MPAHIMRVVVVTALFATLPARAAQAALIDFGGGLIYDTVQDLTWLDPGLVQPPHGAAPGGPAPGSCVPAVCDWYYTWPGAMAWVDGLDYEGYDDWRLPHMFGTSYTDRVDNELHLMLEQLPGWQFGPLGSDISLFSAGDRGPFVSVPEYWFVWMDQPYTYTSWATDWYDIPDSLVHSRGVIAVRSGAPHSTVPEPSTLALLTLGALVAARLKRRIDTRG